jgi:RimJ/RimL family protein N-acetyltransferase
MRSGERPSISVFTVIRERTTGRYTGDLNIWQNDRTWQLGYALHSDLHRRGIGTAAVGAVLARAKESLDADKIQAVSIPRCYH